MSQEDRLRADIRASLDRVEVPRRPLRARPTSTSASPRMAVGLALLLGFAAAASSALLLSHPAILSEETPAATAGPQQTATRFRSASGGFSLTLPASWSGQADDRILNRVDRRLFLISNGPLDTSQIATSAEPGGDWSLVPATRIVLELRERAGGPPPEVPTASVDQASVPPQWSTATAGTDGSFATLSLRFGYLWGSMEWLAHVGPSAPQTDREALAAIAASIRFDDLPLRGNLPEARAFVAGSVGDFPLGSTTLFKPGTDGPAQSFYLVRGAHHFFAIANQAYLGFGTQPPCTIRYDSAQRSFVCDATGDRWDEFGVRIAGDHQLDLGWLGVIVRADRVVVGGALVAGPRQVDEGLDRVR